MSQSLSPRFDADSLISHLNTCLGQEGAEGGGGYRLYRHVPVFTVAEAQAVSGSIPGAHCRNLFLRDKKENMFLLTLRDHTPVDLKKLAVALGVAGRFSFGSAERLWTYLGVRPGAVTPLAILNDGGRRVSLILEQGMMEEPLVNFHPLDNSMTVGMSPQALLLLLEKDHIKPHIIDLAPLAPEPQHDAGSEK